MCIIVCSCILDILYNTWVTHIIESKKISSKQNKEILKISSFTYHEELNFIHLAENYVFQTFEFWFGSNRFESAMLPSWWILCPLIQDFMQKVLWTSKACSFILWGSLWKGLWIVFTHCVLVYHETTHCVRKFFLILEKWGFRKFTF